MEKTFRRYDLDWLRVVVFSLLIFYHVGMFFVPWGWHLKNNIIYDWIKWPMLFLNQWRLPILFLISGMGTFYALSKRTIWQFNKERFLRLGIPLLFGMLVVVPPQIYFERLAEGQFQGSYLHYLSTVAYEGIYPEGNISWHHLWFLPYLFVFSVLLSTIFVYIKKRKTKIVDWFSKVIQKPFGLYIFTLPLYLLESLLEPFYDITHDLINDWFNFFSSMTLFFFGFIMVSCGQILWIEIEKIRKKAFILGILCFIGLLIIWQFEDGYTRHFTEALLKIINLWSWILVLLGYAAKHQNKPSKLLSYANRAVYPFYILHQTITVAIAYYLMYLDWGLLPKALILVIGTFLISWIIYHFIILKIGLLQPLFGIKNK
ncbi:Peptidoglycan/LPS O-acetylase OafA/YrhL, contains acyltransferase and SGNH-hydrolase domains [Maribacter orientalis]|uniref:Peptidoglycan/LPS O-acetylase OafA/YrhL, contains acyltransferase and SGNH-hydrolase domains n=1 Tax=Maribacter orientalis TaxID=228957 RepID=A0A1H7KAJ4_9FLAO|nr:acyltransferase family protein [Maribacter orientalis]SEK83530.1 Peptidoglycan/LPS O-acetylase OafA/YrhL, contains acyltransferase and SGNH-hydrolase domains [Maribacter orientalis]|tara:strand:- start:242 stop:1360 length:1119 start_codon:yes stop_codon:yes gene_type:complete